VKAVLNSLSATLEGRLPDGLRPLSDYRDKRDTRQYRALISMNITLSKIAGKDRLRLVSMLYSTEVSSTYELTVGEVAAFNILRDCNERFVPYLEKLKTEMSYAQ